MAIYQLDEAVPILAEGAWVADSAEVIGQVEIGERSSIWFRTVVRGDSDWIRIGRDCNVQDACVLHTDHGIQLVLGDGVTVGHQAVLHGCTVGEGSLVGIGAVVLNGARIGRHCLVGAGALVTEGKEFPDGSLIVGSPARAVRPLTPEQIQGLARSAGHYARNARRFAAGLRRVDQAS